MHSASGVVEQIETNDDAAAVSGNEALFKEMDLLQGCISRMAENSFRCKEWAVALAVAVLGLCYSDFGSEFLAVVSVFPLMFLWHMDCKYLSLERRFRDRYAFVIHNRPKGNFRGQFELDPSIFDAMTSPEQTVTRALLAKRDEATLKHLSELLGIDLEEYADRILGNEAATNEAEEQ